METVAVVDKLFAHYAAVLDAGNVAAWAELFDVESNYAVYTAADFERGLPLAYMLDDCHERILDRVKFVDEVWRGTVEPYRTRHIFQRTSLDTAEVDTYRVESNVLVAYTDANDVSALLCSGRTEDIIRIRDGEALFQQRKVLLDGTPARYLVYPV